MTSKFGGIVWLTNQFQAFILWDILLLEKYNRIMKGPLQTITTTKSHPMFYFQNLSCIRGYFFLEPCRRPSGGLAFSLKNPQRSTLNALLRDYMFHASALPIGSHVNRKSIRRVPASFQCSSSFLHTRESRRYSPEDPPKQF